MVAHVVDIGGLFLAVFLAGEDAADVGLALGARAEGRGIGQQRLEELDRHDLVPLELDRGGGQHADVLQTLHMGQVGLAKGHKEADALDIRDVLGQRLDLLVVQQVHILVADLVKVVLTLDGHGRDLDPVAVLPVGAGRGNLAQVDLRVEVGRERVAVVAAVAVQNVDGVDLVEQVLLRVRAVCLRHARVKARAQKRGQAGLFELLLVCPLPGVVKVGGEALFLAALLVDRAPLRIVGVLGLVVGGVHVVDAALQARIHDGQVLIGQGDVHDDVRLVLVDQRAQLVEVVRVHLGGADLGGGGAVQLLLDRVALGLRARGDHDLLKNVAVLAALVNDHAGNAAAADNQGFSHDKFLLNIWLA